MKKIELKLWKILIVTLLLGAGVAYLTSTMVKSHREVVRLRTGMTQCADNLRTYKVVVDGLNEQVTESKLTIVNKDAVISRMVEYSERLEAEKIRDVYAIGTLNAEISLLKDSIPLPDSITLIDYICEEDSAHAIVLPFTFDFDDSFLYMWGEVDKQGLGTLGMFMKEAPINVTLGSRGVFGKDYVSAVSSPNPYVDITKNDFTLVSKKNKAPFFVAGGFVTGMVATLLLMR